MSETIDVLRHEHDAILMALSILDRIADEARHEQLHDMLKTLKTKYLV